MIAVKYKVLFLCNKNSARSQMAEAVLNQKASDSFIAFSAGSEPADMIHPLALQVLEDDGFDMSGKKPISLNEYIGKEFDFVITLCDSFKETCPTFPGHPVYAHWGLPDPSEFEGTYEDKLQFFKKTLMEITQRIILFLNIPIEKLDRLALELKVSEIGKT